MPLEIYDVVRVNLTDRRKYELNLAGLESIKNLLDSNGKEYYISGILHAQEDETQRLYNLTKIGERVHSILAAFNDLAFIRKGSLAELVEVIELLDKSIKVDDKEALKQMRLF